MDIKRQTYITLKVFILATTSATRYDSLSIAIVHIPNLNAGSSGRQSAAIGAEGHGPNGADVAMQSAQETSTGRIP